MNPLTVTAKVPGRLPLRLYRRKTGALSLLEVMIAVAVIGFLAVLSLVWTRSMRGTAESAACVSNLRQIGVGMTMYLAENRGFYPPHRWMKRDPNNDEWVWDSKYWYSPLIKYIGKEVFICRTARGIRELDSSIYNGFISYGLNLALVFDYPDTDPEHLRVSEMRASVLNVSSETIVAADAALTRGGNPEYDDGRNHGTFYMYPTSSGGTGNGQAYPRHQGSCNVLWADGHVSSVRATDPKNPRTIYDPNALGKNGSSVSVRHSAPMQEPASVRDCVHGNFERWRRHHKTGSSRPSLGDQGSTGGYDGGI